MFWGLNLKPNRKYTQTTSKTFHISQAALDADSAQVGANQIYISCENQKFLVCTLRKDVCEQVMLDLNFAKGDEICFQSLGSGNVSLSGYIIQDDSMDDLLNGEEEEESETEMEDLRNALNKKAKAKKAVTENAVKGKAKVDVGEEDDDDDEDDSDFNEETVLEGQNSSDDDDAEENDSDDEEDEEGDSDEEDESEDEDVPQPKAKQPKLDKLQKQQNGLATKENAATAAAEKKDKNDKKSKKEKKDNQQKQQQKGERSLTGGVKIEDIRVGSGPEAKTGKRAQVYYEGRLKSNNKVFDSLRQGAGFKFGLGRGEVIKGWDVGVVGMKVGGKRRITCPPHMAYGARGSPPSIPPNSTLVFEVELKSVN